MAGHKVLVRTEEAEQKLHCSETDHYEEACLKAESNLSTRQGGFGNGLIGIMSLILDL